MARAHRLRRALLKDPEFERLHPRAQGGRFGEKTKQQAAARQWLRGAPQAPALDVASVVVDALADEDLLVGLPEGASFFEGKGVLGRGQFAVELPGRGLISNLDKDKRVAVREARQRLANEAFSADQKIRQKGLEANILARMAAGTEPSDADLSTLGLRSSSDLRWFIPKAAELYGTTSHAVRPMIKDLIKVGYTESGSKRESVNAKKALMAIAAARTPQEPGPALDVATPAETQPVDFGDPVRNTPPADEGYVYHATSNYRAYDIAESGELETHGPSYGTEQDVWPDGSEESRSYWTEHPGTANNFYPDDGKPVLLRMPRSSDVKKESGTSDLFIRKAVKAEQLEYFGSDSKWHSLQRLAGPALDVATPAPATLADAGIKMVTVDMSGGDFNTGGENDDEPVIASFEEGRGYGPDLRTAAEMDAHFRSLLGDPVEFKQQISEGMPGTVNVTITHAAASSPHAYLYRSADDISLRFEFIGEDGAPYGTAERQYTRLKPSNEFTVNHKVLRFQPGAQGKGHGKTFMRNSMEVYKRQGVESIHTHANIDVGGYAWAKYGFKLNDVDGPTARAMRARVLGSIGELGNDAKPEERAKLIGAVESGDDNMLWMVADSRFGKRLLTAEDWYGELRLGDAEAMARFDAYVGKAAPPPPKVRIVDPFDYTHFDAAVHEADAALGGEAATAIDDFVGHPPTPVSPFGVMAKRRLEEAVGESTPTARKLEEAFAPVREKLREITGDTVRLHRHQETLTEEGKQRNVLSWTSDVRTANNFSGAGQDRRVYTEDEIRAFEQEYAKTGKVKIGGVELRKEEDSPYPGIFDERAGGFVTDTESVRAYVDGENSFRAETNAENAARRANVVTADVPLEDIVWITDRANQREFIVRNRGVARLLRA